MARINLIKLNLNFGIQSDYVCNAFFGDLEVGGRVRRKVSCNRPLDQPGPDDVVLRGMLISLHQHSGGDTLEEVFSVQRLGFGRNILPGLSVSWLLSPISAARLHVIEDDHAEAVLEGDSLETHEDHRHSALLLAVGQVR